MHTTTLFAILASVFFTLLSCIAALPTAFEMKAPSAAPRSLLGRSYLRHPAVIRSKLHSRAIYPLHDGNLGRVDRFPAFLRKRTAHPAPGEWVSREITLNRTLPLEASVHPPQTEPKAAYEAPVGKAFAHP
ncbi:hypothetical protein H0H87_000451 [Tephrocybe sp. NHM501043]|nr:hypothetical protein H0H87_000451 [Tephrocybe sp. NHM501043]